MLSNNIYSININKEEIIELNKKNKVAVFMGNFAAEYYKKLGFDIVKQNYTCRGGEIDIIAENEEYIVFVSSRIGVKTYKTLVIMVKIKTNSDYHIYCLDTNLNTLNYESKSFTANNQSVISNTFKLLTINETKS